MRNEAGEIIGGCAVCGTDPLPTDLTCSHCGEASWVGAEPPPPAPPACPTFEEYLAAGSYEAENYPPKWCGPPPEGEVEKRDAYLAEKAKEKTEPVAPPSASSGKTKKSSKAIKSAKADEIPPTEPAPPSEEAAAAEEAPSDQQTNAEPVGTAEQKGN